MGEREHSIRKITNCSDGAARSAEQHKKASFFTVFFFFLKHPFETALFESGMDSLENSGQIFRMGEWELIFQKLPNCSADVARSAESTNTKRQHLLNVFFFPHKYALNKTQQYVVAMNTYRFSIFVMDI
ncbi:hypothetical protein CEXT_706491 [Caerostris extrusa]|uniref:Uncharacterized protein n=1 Tax=Caerostris extrusa TaxID=172846 RepID=A0AAV4XSM3_CAEEX|nr:hypothetical protein CEXT_706491 [Caerostris extrusa]